jgi:DNA-binding CsgD family transcriptional regulator
MLGFMQRLDAGDATGLLAFVSELKDVDDPLAFPPAVLRGLKQLIPSDDVSYSELDPIRRQSRLQVWIDGDVDGVEWGPGDDEDNRLFWELRPTHPVCGHRQATGDWTATLKASDFGTLAEFRRTPIYDAFYRGRLDHWFDFGLPALPDRTRVFVFVRHHAPDFTERDRLVASLVRPYLEARAREADTAARASVALAALAERASSEAHQVILCSSNGAIEFASPGARALLKRYLGVDNGRLPSALLGRKRIVLEDGDGLLTIGVARTGSLRVLMLDERDARLERLTAREREILDRVVLGMSNADIGHDLEIASSTVAKHLEHVFEKLGVRNRTAAAALITAH